MMRTEKQTFKGLYDVRLTWADGHSEVFKRVSVDNDEWDQHKNIELVHQNAHTVLVVATYGTWRRVEFGAEGEFD